MNPPTYFVCTPCLDEDHPHCEGCDTCGCRHCWPEQDDDGDE